MTDIRTLLAKAMKPLVDEDNWAYHLADVLLSMPDVAVIELPKLTKDDLRKRYWITYDPAGIYWLNEPTLATPDQVREFAAALLVAANTFEGD